MEDDLKRLSVLNRKEVRAYNARIGALSPEQRRTTVIDLQRTIEAYDHDDTVIKDGNKELPTLKRIVLFSLRAGSQKDVNDSAAKKMERFSLVKRIANADTIELTKSEKEMIKERIHTFHPQIELAGVACELLDTEMNQAPPDEPQSIPIHKTKKGK